ncbi:MAG: outer membrane beta-barrel protein [Saprospiraceae bacterium]
MKFLFTLIAIFNFLPLFSQQDQLPPTLLKPKRFELGIVIAPGITYRTLINHDTSSAGPAIIGVRNDIEKPKVSYKTGISLRYAFSEKAGLTTGIYYAHRGFRQKSRNAFWPSRDTTGIFDPTSSSTVKSSYNFSSIEIPFLLDYTFHKAKFSYSVGIGGSCNYLLRATFSYKITEDNGQIQQATSTDNGPYHYINVSMLLKAGVSYSLNENSAIHLDPTFQYDMTPWLDSVLVKEHLLNFGLHIGYFRAL